MIPVYSKDDCQHCNGTGKAIDVNATNQEIRRMMADKVERNHGFHQKYVAARLNIKQSHFCDLLAGRRPWNIQNLLRLATILE